MKRRSFLKNTSAFALPTFLGGMSVTASAAQRMASLINEDSDRILVLIDMNGGNDGLNSFVPIDAYDNLFNARPNIMIPQNNLIPLTDTISLHPEMQGLKSLYDDAKLKVIQGVGYPNQNRSHFRSADIWKSASNADVFESTGWIGRYLDDKYPNFPTNYPTDDCPDPFAITLGKSISGTCQGAESNFSLAIIDSNNIGGLNTGVESELPDDCYGRELDYLIDTFKKTNAYAVPVIEAAENGSSLSSSYPETTLGEQLQIVAKLISGGLDTKIYVLKLGGFDTHADQVVEGDSTKGEHAELLANLSQSIHAFQEDLKMQGLEKRVLGMTFSEFGRKIKSNAGLGTDHGTAAPMMVFGECVDPGIVGQNPEISADVNIEEGVSMQYDFRSIYGSVLMDWFEVPEDKVRTLISQDFQYIPILGDCFIINSSEDIDINIDVLAKPNPFQSNFSIELNLKNKSNVKIDISDVQGRQIKNVTSQQLQPGSHNILIEGQGLERGVYFARVQINNQVKTLRIVKSNH